MAFSISLDRSPEEWAGQICRLDCTNRCDYVDIFKERQLDFEGMMKKIRVILIGNK